MWNLYQVLLGCRPKVVVGRVVAKSTALHAFAERVLMALTLCQQLRLHIRATDQKRSALGLPAGPEMHWAIQCFSVNLACIYSFLAIKGAVDCLLILQLLQGTTHSTKKLMYVLHSKPGLPVHHQRCSRLASHGHSFVYVCLARLSFTSVMSAVVKFSLMLVAGTPAAVHWLWPIPAGLPDSIVTSSAIVSSGYKLHGNPSGCNCSMIV